MENAITNEPKVLENSLDTIINESKATIAASDTENAPKPRGRPRKGTAKQANDAPKIEDTLAAFKPAGLAPIFMYSANIPVSMLRSKFELTSEELPSLDIESKKIVADQLDLVAGIWLPQGGEANKYVTTIGALAVVGMVYGEIYMTARDIALAKAKNDSSLTRR